MAAEVKAWHSLIHDPDQIKHFAGLFEPSRRSHALCHYLTMRRKYYPSLSQSIIIVDRSAISGGPDFGKRFLQSILKLENPIGTYTDGDVVIPTEAMAFYVIIGAKDTVKALARSLTRCVEALTDGNEINGYSIYREEIPKCETTGGPTYRQIDLDTKDVDEVRMCNTLLQETNIKVIATIETRNGFHILVRNEGPGSKDAFRRMHEFKTQTQFQKKSVKGTPVTDHWFSLTNSPVVILPGTYQGGFPARLITLDAWLDQCASEPGF